MKGINCERRISSVKSTQAYVGLLMFVFINGLFLFKYLGRINAVFGIVSVGIYVAAVFYLSRLLYSHRMHVNAKFNLGLIVLYVCGLLVFLWYIPKESFGVDRWSVITSFWDFALDGKYPYFAQSFSGNYPGPMPFYFILAFPFYLIGEIGLFSISGLLLLLYFFRKKKSDDTFVYSSFLLLSSTIIFWEISCRSTLLINAVLIFILLYFLVDIKEMDKKRFWMSAIISGLLLSTRSSFSLVFVVWGIYVLKNNLLPFRKLFVWGIVFVLSFSLTFLPLVLFFPNDFFVMNPFVIQSSFLLPVNWIPPLFIIAIISGFLCKNKMDVIFYSGLTLFVAILIYFFYHIAGNGVFIALWESVIDAVLQNSARASGVTTVILGEVIDTSYFTMAIPFILYTISSQIHRQ